MAYNDDKYLIIILVIVLLLFLDSIYCNYKVDNLAMIEQDRDDIFKYLNYLTKFLDKHNITYWIIGGTTLGSVRHNDIVPWDDDADIGIFEDDIEKLLTLNDELEKDGYEVIFYWKIYKFIKIGSEYPFIDIFCYKKIDDRYVMHRDDLNEAWPNEYYLENELFPLKKYKFGKLYLNGPNYPINYLDRMYPKWRYIGKHIYDHKENKGTDITIELEHSNPEHKLKPILYVNPEMNMQNEFNLYHNKKIITIE